MIAPQHSDISIRRQCQLIDLNRASFYMKPAGETRLNLHLMRLIDEQYMKTPFYGYPPYDSAVTPSRIRCKS